MEEEELTEEQWRSRRRNAFRKREQIMRKGLTESLAMLNGIPDPDGKILKVAHHIMDVLEKEAGVFIPLTYVGEKQEKPIYD